MNMNYFITGASGFIGLNLLQRLTKRPGTFYLLVRNDDSRIKILNAAKQFGFPTDHLVFVQGDLTQPKLGIAPQWIDQLSNSVTHFFHLAAVYSFEADSDTIDKVNIDGTRHALQLAEKLGAGCFHHVSSIAVAGQYRGWFHEDMFDQAHPEGHSYLTSKLASEALVREQSALPWRIYRPGVVIGDSKTGAAMRIDGPYYFFKLIQKMRDSLPQWMPMLGLEGGRLNLVPVDFVTDAMDHISHKPELNGQCFHLTDPEPFRAGEIVNIFARAGHAPRMAMRIDLRLLELLPETLRKELGNQPLLKRLGQSLCQEFGIPPAVASFFTTPTLFDCRNTQRALEGTDISCPRLEDYAPAIWDYWERNLDPDLHLARSLKARLKGKTVMITGASSGIGKAVALKLAKAGGQMLLVARNPERLQETVREVEELGGNAAAYYCDIADLEAVDVMLQLVEQQFGKVDVLINNAGHSIRRPVINSLNRFHDYERLMQINYFGALRLINGFLPGMIANNGGHIINISSISVLTNPPRFAAYAASKAALESFTRCAAPELIDYNVHMTTIHMPLVDTPMLEPVETYRSVSTLSPEEAAEMVAKAVIDRPKRVATRLGMFGALVHGLFPKLGELIMNTYFHMYPDKLDEKYRPDLPEAQAAHENQQQIQREIQALSSFIRDIHL
jgi:NAD(P)-dependent dehydrogenase (short-subunit alcohol dehydrogenase family)